MSEDTSPPQAKAHALGAHTDRKRKLGRGLGALMGEMRHDEITVSGLRTGALAPDTPTAAQAAAQPASSTRAASGANGLAFLPITSIQPLPGQPRRHFEPEALAELAASIQQRGVIQPVIVTQISAGKYQLVAGERRWRAAQLAGLVDIPALVRELEPREIMALALIENVQREDLNPVEEALAYRQLADGEGLTATEIGKLVDKSRSHVANLQRLLALPQDVLDLVATGALSMGHARALIGHEGASQLAQKAVANSLSVRQVEAMVRSGTGNGERARAGGRTSRDPAKDADIAAVQTHLEELLGLSVKIKADADPRTGAVTIRYRTLDQLDLICQRLTGGDV